MADSWAVTTRQRSKLEARAGTGLDNGIEPARSSLRASWLGIGMASQTGHPAGL